MSAAAQPVTAAARPAATPPAATPPAATALPAATPPHSHCRHRSSTGCPTYHALDAAPAASPACRATLARVTRSHLTERSSCASWATPGRGPRAGSAESPRAAPGHAYKGPRRLMARVRTRTATMDSSESHRYKNRSEKTRSIATNFCYTFKGGTRKPENCRSAEHPLLPPQGLNPCGLFCIPQGVT